MAVTEQIIERIRNLPEPLQAEVVDFVEYLATKADNDDRHAWSDFSLSNALREMEAEDSPYSEKDLKEKFS